MVWETILAEFSIIEGRTVLTAIAFPPALLTRSALSYNRQIHLIHHADDRLCIWNPSRHDMRLLQQQRFKITHVKGWRAYLGNSQHNYVHWTRARLPEGCHDLADLERMPGALPFEVYAQAPLRLLSWCSFELNHVAKWLLRDLAIMCEDPKAGGQNSTTKCQGPRCATRYPVSCFPGHCADSIQSSDAELHHNGPALPGYPATSHCNLHAGLLPSNA